MSRKFPLWKQNTPETCGPACILTLCEYFGIIRHPSVELEKSIYRDYRSTAFKGTPGISVAKALAVRGLRVQLLHSSPEMMENRELYFDEETFEKLFREYHQRVDFCRNLVEIQCDVDIQCDLLKRLLAEGKKLVLQTIVPGDADGIHTHVLHWVVVYGYENGEFLVGNPALDGGRLRLSETELMHYMDTPIGKICIAADRP